MKRGSVTVINYEEQKAEEMGVETIENIEVQVGVLEDTTNGGVEVEESWVQRLQRLVIEIESVENSRVSTQAGILDIEKEVEAIKNMLADYQERYESLLEIRDSQVQELNELRSKLRELADDSSY